MATYARMSGDTNEVYYETLDYAFKKGEADSYRMSRRCDYDCCAMIEDMTERWAADSEQARCDRQKKILEEFGLERCRYIAAATVKGNTRVDFPEDVKAWAETVRISDDRYVNATNVVQSKLEPMEKFVRFVMSLGKVENRTENETTEGESDERSAEGEGGEKSDEGKDEERSAEAEGGEKSDGGESEMDPGTEKEDGDSAKDLVTAQKSDERAREDEKTGDDLRIRVTLPASAVIRSYPESYFCRMPFSGDYPEYVFNVPARCVEKNDEGYVLSLSQNFSIRARNGAEVKTLTVLEFVSAVEGKEDKDFRREGTYASEIVKINLPENALVEERERSYLFALLDGSTFFVGKSLVSPAKNGYEIAMPSSFSIKTSGGEGGSSYTPAEIKKIAEESNWANFSASNLKRTEWRRMEVAKKALVYENEKRMLFRMPDGEYEKCSYYYPKRLVTNMGDRFVFSLPSDFEAELLESDTDGKTTIGADALFAAANGKGDDFYTDALVSPSKAEKKNRFFTETALRENVPKEMREKPNWVVVRTSKNLEKNKLDKFLISPVTGKFAESDNPKSWCDFETACRYARENGGDTLAYALDGDGVCCLDIDRCIDLSGIFSEKATSALAAGPSGTYREISVSGNGLHIFGKIKTPLSLRSFSRDNGCEFYRDCHFISMTGNGEMPGKTLESFDTPEMTAFLKSNFDKRKTYKNAGRGLEGISSMSDREVLDKAFSSRGGDVTKRLFDGEDIKCNRSNSDMALMNRLAFWCNGDKEQMLRLFYASGLYRPEKSQDYYECTVMKALEWVPERYDAPPKKSPDGSGKGNGSGRQK